MVLADMGRRSISSDGREIENTKQPGKSEQNVEFKQVRVNF
jgi:hypothetical protein